MHYGRKTSVGSSLATSIPYTSILYIPKQGRYFGNVTLYDQLQYVDFGFSECIALWEFFLEKFGDNFTSG